MKSATVAVVGRPSAGKSTLVNTICEMKVSITAKTPQTTRNAIKGIYTDQRGQLIFIDTPGYHLGTRVLNLRLQETAVKSLSESDLVLYLIDGKRSAKEEELSLARTLAKLKTPVICLINKADILTEEEIEEAKGFLKEQLPSSPILIGSAKNDEGIDEVLIELFKVAPEGPLLYDENAYTDQELEFRIAELIREKAIALVTEELPHAIYVDVADIEYKEETNTIWIRAFIVVERESQKGIVIGKGGENMTKIRKAVEPEIRSIFPKRKLRLDLKVKANPRWRTKPHILDNLLR